MLTTIISFGVILALGLTIFCTIKWWNLPLTGVTPVPLFTFIAILFTSGLDVGLIMFPLAFDFPLYADTATEPAYGFTNPLALEFGFWGFLIWTFYFLTTFYFCAIEPRVKFFEIPAIKLLNNIVIITTCAFTDLLPRDPDCGLQLNRSEVRACAVGQLDPAVSGANRLHVAERRHGIGRICL